jgi:hypothetical protein
VVAVGDKFSYAVTARGLAAEKLLEELYRQVFITMLQGKGTPSQLQRFNGAKVDDNPLAP